LLRKASARQNKNTYIFGSTLGLLSTVHQLLLQGLIPLTVVGKSLGQILDFGHKSLTLLFVLFLLDVDLLDLAILVGELALEFVELTGSLFESFEDIMHFFFYAFFIVLELLDLPILLLQLRL
jgi:hypothetical protein